LGNGACTVFFYRQPDNSNKTGQKSGESGDDSSEIDGISDWFTGLNAEETVCWAFGTVPSQLDFIFWNNSDDDITTKIKLQLGFEKAKSTESTQAHIYVASSALGGKKTNKATKNEFEAAVALSNLFGEGSVATSAGTKEFEGLDSVFEKLDKIDNG